MMVTRSMYRAFAIAGALLNVASVAQALSDQYVLALLFAAASFFFNISAVVLQRMYVDQLKLK